VNQQYKAAESRISVTGQGSLHKICQKEVAVMIYEKPELIVYEEINEMTGTPKYSELPPP